MTFVFELDSATAASKPKAQKHPRSHCVRFREPACPNSTNVRVQRACGDQSIHAQTIITFAFQDHTVLKHPCPHQTALDYPTHPSPNYERQHEANRSTTFLEVRCKEWCFQDVGGACMEMLRLPAKNGELTRCKTPSPRLCS